VNYEYNNIGRIARVYEGSELLTSYFYDALGRQIRAENANGITQRTAYNRAGLVTSVRNLRGNETISSYTYTYNYDGNQRTKTELAGTTAYFYDGLNRLETAVLHCGTVQNYEFDENSNRTKLTVIQDDETSITTYAYDANDRITSRNIDGITEHFTYDRNGNMLSRSGGTVTVIQTFDLLNRMRTWTNGVSTAVYDYNPDNMRRAKTVDGITTSHVWVGSNIALDIIGSDVVSYIQGRGGLVKSDYGWYVFNAHGDVVQLADNDGKITRNYDYDPYGNQRGNSEFLPRPNYGDVNGDGIITAADVTLLRRYIAADCKITFLAETPNFILANADVNGDGVIDNADVDLLRAHIAASNPATVPLGPPLVIDKNPFRFNGQYFDVETNYVYLRHRYYDTSLGRFISEDPIFDGMNWYVFAANNPIMFHDPSGLAILPAIPAVIKGAKWAVAAIYMAYDISTDGLVTAFLGEVANTITTGVNFLIVPKVSRSTPTFKPAISSHKSKNLNDIIVGGGITIALPTPALISFPRGAVYGIEILQASQRGKGNKRHTQYQGVSNEELNRIYTDPKTTKEEKQKIKEEQKARGTRRSRQSH
jgi:RHS repeat-associated protein